MLTTLALTLLMSASAVAAQQSSSSSSDQSPPAQSPNQSQGQGQSGSHPAAPPADSNAFPEAESEKAASQASQDQADQNQDDQKKDVANPPAASQPGSPPQGSADGNAFPEEESRKAADAAKAAEEGAAPASGVSSSSDYDTRVNGRNAVTPNVSMSHIHGGKDPLKEDVQVGTYYLQSGNFQGAYSRFKEATVLHPESTDAMFGLAEASRHLHKNDEALSNYKLFLDIVPSGSKAKDARKALASLENAH